MNNIKEYKLLTSDSAIALSQGITKYLQSGWELWGSPSFIRDNFYSWYAQAVIKREDDKTSTN